MALSARGERAAQPSQSSQLSKVLQNGWHPKRNPSGYVSLGLAENSLMHDALLTHVRDNLDISQNIFTYGDGFTGSRRLKSAISRLLTKYLNPCVPVEPAHVTVTNGCSAAIEHLTWSLVNPGECLLLGRPFYTRLNQDPSLRMGAKIIPVSFRGGDPLGVDCVVEYEKAFQHAQTSGQKVAGLLLCNPHNPLGRCYPREALLRLLQFCQKHQIHIISDEIYALSIWPNLVDSQCAPAPFESCLSLATTEVIDPSLIHVVWGISKDFGANGLRVGAIISQQNAALHASLVPPAIHSSSSSISDHVTANILEDDAWIEGYLSENRRRLAEHHKFVAEWAAQNAVPYAPAANAAFFLWVDLASAYKTRHAEWTSQNADDEIAQALLGKGVFLASGKNFGAEEPGWFRIVFSLDKNVLQEGLHRIVLALEEVF